MFGSLFGGGGGGAKMPKIEKPTRKELEQYTWPIGTRMNPGYPTRGGSLTAFGAATDANSWVPISGGGGGFDVNSVAQGLSGISSILGSALGGKSATASPAAPTFGSSPQGVQMHMNKMFPTYDSLGIGMFQ